MRLDEDDSGFKILFIWIKFDESSESDSSPGKLKNLLFNNDEVINIILYLFINWFRLMKFEINKANL